MLTELSLNILDIAENSTKAKATLVEINVSVFEKEDLLVIEIKDNGCGMNEEQLEKVTDPFFTSRTTRNVGLGIPFFKYAAESTGGSFEISSKVGVGTEVSAKFTMSHVDRMPMGDITTTIHNLIVFHPEIDYLYTYTYNEKLFSLDTREFREILGGVPFNEPEIADYIKEFLVENKKEVDNGAIY